jgi:glycosyltransferase involved in cell wall biosynthesis
LDFVTDDIGIVAPAEDVDALMQAIQVLAHNAPLRASMGAGGRAKVVAAHTEDHAADVAAQAWRRVLA